MIKEIKSIVEYALYKIDSYSDDALALVVRTGMAESGYRALEGYGEGNPALGFFQMEPNTAIDIWNNYVAYRTKYKYKLQELGFRYEDLEFCLLSNIGLQVAFCRLHYRRVPDALPKASDLEGQAKYWKKFYNSHLGRGTIKHFMEANS